MAGKRGVRLNPLHQESVRAKIQCGVLLDILHKDATGEKPISDGSRTSAMYLLTQAIGKPHQSMAVEHTHQHVSELTDAELAKYLPHHAGSSRSGASETTPGAKEPGAVH